ncbi:MAG TPA: hypothetical protein VME46_15620 [Acidimicrobiales bacterium]|nr:hypothetical protein [Acidimicrobiales bacterium]
MTLGRTVRQLAMLASCAGLVVTGLLSGPSAAQANIAASRPGRLPSAPGHLSTFDVPAPGTVLYQLMHEVGPDGAVPLATALQAFSLEIAPLPGVRLPAGRPGAIADGTFAMDWALRHWNQLAPAQKATVRRFLVGPTTMTGDAGRTITGPLPLLAAARTLPASGPYFAELKADETIIAGHIGHSMDLAVSAVVSPVQVPGKGPGTALAFTTPYDSRGGFTGRPTKCVVTLEPALWREHPTASVTADTLMHEMFHCFQATDYSTPDAFFAAPDWLIEGSAEWVGQTLSPDTENCCTAWVRYLTNIATPLFSRSYDAIGFYAHMEETGTDPWGKFDAMFKAPTSATAYAVATDAEFKLTWASSLLRRPAFGDGWDTTGPSIPQDAHYVPTVHVLAVGESLSGKVAPYTNAILGVASTANALQFTATTRYSRLHDSGDHDIDGVQGPGDTFCLNNCDEDTVLEALPRLHPGEVWLAVTGDTAGARYAVEALSETPCLLGDWVTTRWIWDTAQGKEEGLAGVHITVTPDLGTIDYDGSQPIDEIRFMGTESIALHYSQSLTATSGILAATRTSSHITVSLDGGKPVSADQNPFSHVTGTWACSGSAMSWRLRVQGGSELVDFARLSYSD